MKATVNQIKEMIREIIKEEDSGYKAFFNSALKKFGASSIADLGDKKAEFFKYVDDNYTAKTETLEPVSDAAGEPEYNPTKRLKAKKRDQILASEAKGSSSKWIGISKGGTEVFIKNDAELAKMKKHEKGLKAKLNPKFKSKNESILKTEKVENYIRKLVREELKFVMFNDVPGGLSMKRAKKRILQKGSAKTDSTV